MSRNTFVSKAFPAYLQFSLSISVLGFLVLFCFIFLFNALYTWEENSMTKG